MLILICQSIFELLLAVMYKEGFLTRSNFLEKLFPTGKHTCVLSIFWLFTAKKFSSRNLVSSKNWILITIWLCGALYFGLVEEMRIPWHGNRKWLKTKSVAVLLAKKEKKKHFHFQLLLYIPVPNCSPTRRNKRNSCHFFTCAEI